MQRTESVRTGLPSEIFAQAPGVYNKLRWADDLSAIQPLARFIPPILEALREKLDILQPSLTGCNPYQRAVLLSPFSSAELPSELKENLGIVDMEDTHATPKAVHESWLLCGKTEERTKLAIQRDAAMLVGGLVVKFEGRSAAFCTTSFSTLTGTFIAGNFYSPSPETQKELKKHFTAGTRSPVLEESEWYLMRSVRGEHENGLSEGCRAFVDRGTTKVLPTTIEGMSRERYLDYSRELYFNE